MSGIVAGCLAGFAIIILVLGVIGALALADAPSAVAVAAGLCTAGVAGVTLVYLRRWRLSGGRFRLARPRPRPRPLTGWRLTAAAALSAACGFGSVIAGFSGSLTWSAVLAVFGAALGVWCAVVRCAVARWAERDCWTDEELTALDDAAGIEQFLDAVPRVLDSRRKGPGR